MTIPLSDEARRRANYREQMNQLERQAHVWIRRNKQVDLAMAGTYLRGQCGDDSQPWPSAPAALQHIVAEHARGFGQVLDRIPAQWFSARAGAARATAVPPSQVRRPGWHHRPTCQSYSLSINQHYTTHGNDLASAGRFPFMDIFILF